MHKHFQKKAKQWKDLIKIGRTHMQDATPITLGQEFSGYAVMLEESIKHLNHTVKDLYALALGGTAIGTGINAPTGFDKAIAKEIAQATKIPFKTAANKFAVQGAHDAILRFSASLKTCAASIYKIVNDIRLLSSGPRAGLYELILPSNEPGSSIMPGKVNPTQCEALSMVTMQVIANDFAITMGGSGGYLEMNVYKPLMIINMIKSLHLLSDSISNFNQYLLEGIKPNHKRIELYVQNALMLVTALNPIIGYDKAAKIAQYALAQDISLKEAGVALGHISAKDFDRYIDAKKMLKPSSKK